MALTRAFSETIRQRAQIDAAFRSAMLIEAAQALVSGEAEVTCALLRDYINATLGFETLASETGISAKSLHRMFGPKGNPTLNNLSRVLRVLEMHEQVKLEVSAQSATSATV